MRRATRAALSIAVAWGAGAGVGAGALAGDEDPRDVAWRRFPVFVWFNGGPAAGPAAFDVLRRHGLLGCNVEGSASSDDAAKAGAPFYVDHLAGKGDLYLRPAEFEKDQARLAQDLLGFRPVRPNCFVATEVAARLDRLVDEGLARHAAHRPLAWVLDDELSVTRGVNPMDYCFGPECLDGLRRWLLARDGTLAKVNAAWGTDFKSVKELVPPTTEAARAAASSGTNQVVTTFVPGRASPCTSAGASPPS